MTVHKMSYTMNGAESLLRTLVKSGIEVCFANPGTSEMHLVAALDRVSGLRPVLGLQENVVTGAADGYARMALKPACTLLHLGPGLGNGLANLHNARKASSAIVNIVGDHASSHARYDAPLSSDIRGIAGPVSDWVHATSGSLNVAADAARAVREARAFPGKIATLILPADSAWDEAQQVAEPLPFAEPSPVADRTIEDVVSLLVKARHPAMLIRGNALHDEGLAAAQRIAAKTRVRLLCDTFTPRIRRGRGLVEIERLPYFGEEAAASLAGVDLLILVGARAPVSFFAYPDKPSWLAAPDTLITVLSHPHEDGSRALSDLAVALGATVDIPFKTITEESRGPASGKLDARAVMRTVARHLPQDSVIADEAISSGFPWYGETRDAKPHDYLNLTGGAIGSMMAVSAGAAVACPGRKIVTLVGDGSAMYTLQTLWTQARENLDVITIIFSNRGYRVLNNELLRVGVTRAGIKATSMLELTRPSPDWVKLGQGFGVESNRADNCRQFDDLFLFAVTHKGPFLIEAVID